jgi:hypothetical protein
MRFNAAPQSGGSGGETKNANDDAKPFVLSFAFLVSPPELAACSAGRPRRIASVALWQDSLRDLRVLRAFVMCSR